MKRHFAAQIPALVAAAAALGVLASGTIGHPVEAQQAVPRTEAPVPFKVGETLTYDVTWSSYLVAGSATTTVKERRPSADSNAYYIVAEGQPLPLLQKIYKIYYRMDTLVDIASLLSQRTSLESQVGGSQRLATTTFNRASRRAVHEDKAETPARVDFAVPAQVQDGLSALYSLRANPLKTGQRVAMPVADGGALYNVTMDVGAVERLRVPAGEMGAWNVKVTITDAKGQPAATNAAVWISNDARRLPLKLQAGLPVGDFVLALRDVR
jgi:hypothetical protein